VRQMVRAARPLKYWRNPIQGFPKGKGKVLMAKNKPKQVEEENELNRMGPSGLKWLYELEAVNSSTLQNNLYMNLYSFPHVKDVELIMDRYQKKMLIYVKFSWVTRKFRKARRHDLVNQMLDQLQEVLPSFEFRIIEDRVLFELALKKAESALFGGAHADPRNANNRNSDSGIANPSNLNSRDQSTDKDAAGSDSSDSSDDSASPDPKKPSRT
jgi:hypothetical protein